MKRKLINKNKVKYSHLVRCAVKEDLGLHNLLKVLAGVQEMKQLIRIGNRYGTEENWDEVEMSAAMVTVPIVSRKDGRVLSYAAYFSAEMLPPDRKAQYSSFFESDSAAKGILSGIDANQSFTDEDSRDSAIEEER